MYCKRADLTDYVLAAYLDAAEEQSPGIVDKTIANVSGEIDDALRPLYRLPLDTVPVTLNRIAAVMVGYRVIGAITSLMSSEASGGNEWIPLQTQYKAALKDLDAIRSKCMDLGLDELGEEQVEGTSMAVVSRPSRFDFGSM